MEKKTIQRCPNCQRVYRHGVWFEPDYDDIKKIVAAVTAGSLQILDITCQRCDDFIGTVGYA